MASASSSQLPPPPSPTVLLFARGVVALLDLWPALTIAVAEQWGGSDSAEKRVWMASTILDEFEQRINYITPPPSATPAPLQINPKDASDPPLDLDDLADLINQMMTDEFEAKVEDGSIDAIAGDIVRLWRDLLIPSANNTPESLIAALEAKATSVRRSGVNASKGDDLVEIEGDSDDSGSESEDGMDVDEAPQLVPREKERVEPVVDDDGFTLVQTKGRKGR